MRPLQNYLLDLQHLITQKKKHEDDGSLFLSFKQMIDSFYLHSNQMIDSFYRLLINRLISSCFYLTNRLVKSWTDFM